MRRAKHSIQVVLPALVLAWLTGTSYLNAQQPNHWQDADPVSIAFIAKPFEQDLESRSRRSRHDRPGQWPAGTRVEKDIPYVSNPHPRQKLDLYLPPVPNNRPDDQGLGLPLVIWIHGGGWRGGNKENCPARFLLGHGFAVASLNYRLSQHATFPAQISDCQQAVQFLRRNAKKYRIDPNRFGVWGSSAGGHLAALLGTSRSGLFVPPGGPKISSRVQAVCDYFGPIDFVTMNAQSGPESRIDHDAPNSPESLLLGGAVQENRESASAASPATYVSDDDPPFLIVHGDQDRLVPVEQSRKFHERLQQSDVDSTLKIVKGGGHGGFNQNQSVLEFFQDRLMSASAVKPVIDSDLVFSATFDGTPDANLFGEDGWIYTAEDIGRKRFSRGIQCEQVTLAKGQGVSGDCLRFHDKTKQVLFYKVAGNFPKPGADWSGTVSFWLKLDPDKDLKPGFCDPIQITQNKWNDAAIWVDFENSNPRTFRLGMFSDFRHWNPANEEFDKIPSADKPLLTVARPPFAGDKWTQVVITFDHVNSSASKRGTARLYLDGKPAGSINQHFKLTWTIPVAETGKPEPAIMLGLNYIGDLDELRIYQRALNAREIAALHQSTIDGESNCP